MIQQKHNKTAETDNTDFLSLCWTFFSDPPPKKQKKKSTSPSVSTCKAHFFPGTEEHSLVFALRAYKDIIVIIIIWLPRYSS